jgi:hypothetical protein
MTSQTPKLAMPFIMPSQAQKHVTHNEAIELLDMIVQLTLESASATVPSLAPVEGQAWALGAAPTNDWTGQGGKIASWRGGGWLYVSPQDGWMAWCKDDTTLKVYTGGGWQVLAAPAV